LELVLLFLRDRWLLSREVHLHRLMEKSREKKEKANGISQRQKKQPMLKLTARRLKRKLLVGALKPRVLRFDTKTWWRELGTR